ncbi:hypothetical protein MUP46_03715 [Patescibacteria group bacterium]|nr:hypothetical protein [Patescibacteria group bacterium]
MAAELVLQGGDSPASFRTILKKFPPPADKADMDQLTEQAPDIQDSYGIESQDVPPIEPDMLIPIDEYAVRHSVSRRTLDRYVQTGRLETEKRHGRTYVIDRPPKSHPFETRQARNGSDSQLALFDRTQWIQLGYLKARARSKTVWQVYAIVLTVLCVALLLSSLWLYLQWQIVL